MNNSTFTEDMDKLINEYLGAHPEVTRRIVAEANAEKAAKARKAKKAELKSQIDAYRCAILSKKEMITRLIDERDQLIAQHDKLVAQYDKLG